MLSARQRWVSVAGLVIVLWAAAGAVLPFRPAYQRAGCGPPAVEAFKPDDKAAGLNAARRQAGLTGDLRFPPLCREPARLRLERSGVIGGAAIVGTVAAVFLLRVPRREEEPRP